MCVILSFQHNGVKIIHYLQRKVSTNDYLYHALIYVICLVDCKYTYKFGKFQNFKIIIMLITKMFFITIISLVVDFF